MMIQFVLAQQGGSPQSGLVGLLPIALIIVIFYFLMYRPMRKRQKTLESMIAGLKNGDRVITNGGIYGTVAGIKDHTFILKISDQVKIEISKSAIASMQSPQDGAQS